jgi:hypothetical protein
MRFASLLRRVRLAFVVAAAGCVGGTAPHAPSVDAPAPGPTAADEAPSPDDSPVELDATTVPFVEPPKPADGRPRLGSIKWSTMIWAEPTRGRGRLAIGRVRMGEDVALKSTELVVGDQCPGRWWAIEPFGYVCNDDTVTRDFEAPYWKALQTVRRKPGAWPYRYAWSTGAPMYARVPTPEEAASAEAEGFGPVRTFASLGKWSRSHEWLVDTDPSHAIGATDPMPSFYADHRDIPGSPWLPGRPKVRVIPAGSGFAYATSFEADGRVWLVTPDLFVIPADRAFPYKRSEFHGVELGGDVTLPLLWVRGRSAPKLARTGDGAFVATGESFPYHAHVPLSGEEATVGKVVHHKVRGQDAWIAEAPEITVTRAVTELHVSMKPDEKWIEAKINSGTMTAYEGLKPVWTTLWSAGKGGIPTPGTNHVKSATTSMGVFPFEWKERVATMSPDGGAPTVFWFGDVPHIQYVRAPLAMHVAFWHDNFGYWMSAECLNVSHLDGEWLFGFTEPKLPEGWNAIAPSKLTGASTRVHIRP